MDHDNISKENNQIPQKRKSTVTKDENKEDWSPMIKYQRRSRGKDIQSSHQNANIKNHFTPLSRKGEDSKEHVEIVEKDIDRIHMFVMLIVRRIDITVSNLGVMAETVGGEGKGVVGEVGAVISLGEDLIQNLMSQTMSTFNFHK